MLKRTMIFTLLAVGLLAGGSSRAEDAQSRIQGQALAGKDNSQNQVLADLNGTSITVFDIGYTCGMPYRALVTTKKKIKPGENESLSSCEIYKCTNQRLKQKCKDQPDNFKIACTGNVNATPEGVIRLELKYLDEYWEVPRCGLKKTKDKQSVLFLLQRPATGSQQASDIQNMVDCYMHNLLYPVKDHPLQQQCGSPMPIGRGSDNSLADDVANILQSQ